MDSYDYITVPPERKRGQHLGQEERGVIQQLKKQGCSLRIIAGHINCSPSTVLYELRRGMPPRRSHKGRIPEYSAKRGQAVYKSNRMNCKKSHYIIHCRAFISWVVQQVREHHWSLDACVGYARLHRLFQEDEMVCSKTLYNELIAGNLPLSVFEMPEVLKRRRIKRKNRINKRPKGRSIDERPSIVDDRVELGHWEADTVVGRRNGKEAVILSLVERVTDNYLAIQIPGKNSKAVMDAMATLHTEYGELFSRVFRTITCDNGSEFEGFVAIQQWGTDVYYAHPYSSWERPVNERHNGLFRRYIPKGVSIEQYSPEDVLAFADELNSLPRRRLGYSTPEELFETFLDDIYAA